MVDDAGLKKTHLQSLNLVRTWEAALLECWEWVPNMEAKLISGVRFESLPSSYVRPESERPRLFEVVDCDNVPVIDLGSEDRSLMIKQIGDACQEYGFFQDLHGAGLQVFKDGKWLAVQPHPNAFVINIGDQLQALSNGKYKSVWHRGVVNADSGRLSVASFLCPCESAIISAPKELTEGADSSVYRDYTYAEYYKKLNCLELFRN